MAIEGKRGCGYRKVDGLYLVGEYIPIECDRLPLEVGHCPVCGAGIHFTRSMTEINPFKLWGSHDYCHEERLFCKACQPPDEVAYIMMVGEKFYTTPLDFIKEGIMMGVSKRIPFIPKKLIIGKTIIYLAHPKAIEVKAPVLLQYAMATVDAQDTQKPRLIEAEAKPLYKLGVFAAFIPQRIEKLIKESDATEKTLHDLAKRGISAVVVPDGDKDHQK